MVFNTQQNFKYQSKYEVLNERNLDPTPCMDASPSTVVVCGREAGHRANIQLYRWLWLLDGYRSGN